MNKHPELSDWHEGKPPFIGEWNASIGIYLSPRNLRWWDGKRWSMSYLPGNDEDYKRATRRKPASLYLTASEVKSIVWRGLAKEPKNFTEPLPLEKYSAL